MLGAAAAQVGAIRYSHRNPKVYGFGSVPLLWGECNLLPDENNWSFVNTENDDDFHIGSMEYDSLQFDPIVFLNRPGSLIEGPINLELVPDYVGKIVILPPHGSSEQETDTTAIQPAVIIKDSHYEIGTVNLDLPDWEWADLVDTTSTSWKNLQRTAHAMSTYRAKVDKLLQFSMQETTIATDGFAPGTWCSYDWTCGEDQKRGRKGFCPKNGICSTGGYKESCWHESDCQSGRCEWDSSVDHWAGGGYRCWLRLPNGEGCNEHNDCISGRCNMNKYALFKCMAKKPNGSFCNENRDCMSNSCKTTWKGWRCV